MTHPDAYAAVLPQPASIHARGPEWARPAHVFGADETDELAHIAAQGYTLVPLYGADRPAPELGALLAAVTAATVTPAEAVATLAEHLAAAAGVLVALAATDAADDDTARTAATAAETTADTAGRLAVLATTLTEVTR